MNTIIIIACIVGALACAGWALRILSQPPDHEVEGCIQKPRGWRN